MASLSKNLFQEALNDLVFRKVRGILNKLTPEKFEKLSNDLLHVELNSVKILQGVILLIFEKALNEPKYSSMYAQLCKRLSEGTPNFETEGTCTFRVLLLNKCRDEFENRSKANEAYEMRGSDLTPEEEERRQIAKRKMLGNIKFIGELGKLEILSESIIHKCIQELLFKKRQSRADQCEDLECLSQIMRTCGRILDSEKGQKLMNQYFERMLHLSENMDLPPRIRFMLRDVVELRRDDWKPRKATNAEGPMPINQLRPLEDDVRSSGFGRRDRDGGSDRQDMFRLPMKTRGGIDDMLNNINHLDRPLVSNMALSQFDEYRSNHNSFGGGREQGYRGGNNQRGNYNNYNNRGGNGGNYNKHNNQHSNNMHNSQYNNNAMNNKDTPPRFKNMLLAVAQTTQAVSLTQLRPPANSMLCKPTNVVKPPQNLPLNTRSVNSTSVSSNIQPLQSTVPTKPLPAPHLKEPPLIIKQSSLDKPKQAKKDKGPNKEEVLKKLNTLLDDYLKNEKNSAMSEAVSSYEEFKVPEKFAKDAVLTIFNAGLDLTEQEKIKVVDLLCALRKNSIILSTAVQDGLKSLLNSIPERETELPRITSLIAMTVAHGVSKSLFSLADIAGCVEHEIHYPMFLLVLQQLNRMVGKGELTKIFNASKVNLIKQLPESERTKERLAEILEDRGLAFLCPLLRIQSELAKQLQADSNPQHFYKWIKENLEATTHSEPGFINALVTVLLKHITEESSGEKEREKQLLERYTVVLKAFLHGKPALQVTAVYSLQVYCYSLGFPKGVLLRWFMALYDLEVIEEEAFLHWKEDLTDAYPGKGQALFQVNSWLMWLQEAESEEDEDADD